MPLVSEIQRGRTKSKVGGGVGCPHAHGIYGCAYGIYGYADFLGSDTNLIHI